MSSLTLIRNLEFYARIKYINVQYYYIYELTEDSVVKLKYCNTDNMTVNYLTKSLIRKKFITKIRQLDMK